MENLKPYSFIIIGLYIRALRHCSTRTLRSFIIDQGERLLGVISKVDFPASDFEASKLRKFIEKTKTMESGMLTQIEVDELARIMTLFEEVVWAESSTKSIFIVNEGVYSLEKLMNYPEKMFAVGIFEKLPEIAKYDLRESFLCLPFSRATAAAFHILRATEAVLKEVYKLNIKRNRLDKPTWGDMTSALKKRRNIDQGLITRLDYIRLNYRNETDHPLLKYSPKDAENIVGLCVEVIEKMSTYFLKMGGGTEMK